MTSAISHTTFNCDDAFALSEWWKKVPGYQDIAGDPNEPGDEECMIIDPMTGHRLLFIEVDELQTEPGRVHLDLKPTERSRDEEIARIVDLGASEIADRRNPDGTGWMVLSDPAGNHFCVLRIDAERAVG